MGMATTDVALSVDVPITQAGLQKAEVGTAGVVRVESGLSDDAPSNAADLYARPMGLKSARIGGAETIFQITIPAAPVTFNVLLSGDVHPRDKKLAGSNLSATFGMVETVRVADTEGLLLMLGVTMR
jgi:hypothetical protein